MSQQQPNNVNSLLNGDKNMESTFKKPQMNIYTKSQSIPIRHHNQYFQASTEQSPISQSSLLLPDASPRTQSGPYYKKFDFVPLSPVEEASVKSVGTEMKQKIQNKWRNAWAAQYSTTPPTTASTAFPMPSPTSTPPTSLGPQKSIAIPHRNRTMRNTDIWVRNMTTDKDRREESSTPTEFFIRNPFLSNTPPTPTAGASHYYATRNKNL